MQSTNNANTEHNQQKYNDGFEKKPEGGLKFMPLRFGVINKRRELRMSGIISASEYFVLEEIELTTIGAQNKNKDWCSEANFSIVHLAQNLNMSVGHVYRRLKSLREKKLIIRQDSLFKGKQILGLNPEVFGQILIDYCHAQESKRKAHLLQSLTSVSAKFAPVEGNVCASEVQSLHQKDENFVEIIEEKIPPYPSPDRKETNPHTVKTDEKSLLANEREAFGNWNRSGQGESKTLTGLESGTGKAAAKNESWNSSFDEGECKRKSIEKMKADLYELDRAEYERQYGTRI